MNIKSFFDHNTSSFTYVVNDKISKECVIIDPVLEYDIFSGKITTKAADKLILYINENNLKVKWILETHIHADHITAAGYIKKKTGTKIGIGKGIIDALQYWVPLFNISKTTPQDGSQFDHLFQDKEIFNIGNLQIQVLFTPGHTPVCVSYVIGDSIFVGDTLFMPSLGTARADFPGGDAKTLYQSIRKILSFPNETNLYMSHDYPQEGEFPREKTTVKEEKEQNILINEEITLDEYIEKREARDATLSIPRLLFPSIQINIRAGEINSKEENDISYIKVPINQIL